MYRWKVVYYRNNRVYSKIIETDVWNMASNIQNEGICDYEIILIAKAEEHE